MGARGKKSLQGKTRQKKERQKGRFSKKDESMTEASWDEIEKRLRERRIRKLRRTFVALCICAAAVIAYVIVMKNTVYGSYTVREEVDRTDTAATQYETYHNGFLKYSSDGASYVTAANDIIWNQSYELGSPMAAVCGNYCAIADSGGDTVYIFDEDGLTVNFSVSYPIVALEISKNGEVAILMDGGTASYISMYDREGDILAEGAIYAENSGFPIDIALSEDGENLAAAIIDVSSGSAETIINFYNFGSAGEKTEDYLVAAYTYEDTIIAEISYAGSNTMLAFADSGVYVFTGSSSPILNCSLEVEDEILSIFYDDKYFGLVFTAEDTEETGRTIKVYDFTCTAKVVIQTELLYENIKFLDNHEVCLYSDTECSIFTLTGLEKFSYTFEETLVGVYRERGLRNYIIMKENTTERVRLKIGTEEE